MTLAYRVEGTRVECAVGPKDGLARGKKIYFSGEGSMLE